MMSAPLSGLDGTRDRVDRVAAMLESEASRALWGYFCKTGYVGAYLLYRRVSGEEQCPITGSKP